LRYLAARPGPARLGLVLVILLILLLLGRI
jgi:hypothetical protein